MNLRSLNYCRVVAMGCILACHFLQYFESSYAFFLNGGVYCFLLISGIIFGLRDIADIGGFYKKRLSRILIPYLFLLVVYVVYQLVFQGGISKRLIWNVLCLQWFVGGIEDAGHLWFITCILLCYLLVPLLQRISPQIKKLQPVLFWTTMVFLALVMVVVARLLHIDILFVYTFMFGYFYTKKYGFSAHACKGAFDVAIMCFGAVFMIARVIYEIYNGRINSIVGNLQEIASSFALLRFLSCCLDEKSVIRIFDPLMSVASKFSFDIYLVHHLFILGPLCVMNVSDSIAVNIILALSLSVVAGVVLHWISAIPIRLLSK